MVELMTLNELMAAFRSEGIGCGYDALSELILSGKLPFAIGTKVNERNKFIIFRKGYEAWINEKR